MNKEQFLAMSLPYGLKFYGKRKGWVSQENKWMTLCPVDLDDRWDNIKPILHPLSDLTKEIEHKGDRFVPMVRLLETALGVHIDINCIELSVKDGIHLIKKGGVKFGFYSTDNFFVVSLHDCLGPIPKQLELFQKLIEYHFDIAGLIEKGEAIDVNTLSENPYK